jgi:hypothetical protein
MSAVSLKATILHEDSLAAVEMFLDDNTEFVARQERSRQGASSMIGPAVAKDVIIAALNKKRRAIQKALETAVADTKAELEERLSLVREALKMTRAVVVSEF